ncbi:N-acetyldiaminopimelate deacetylase [Oenococcus sp.]|uniref:N-acetyldiaminopimelate deacetylase n=1 Tax=Oenococcus sp. TaxID=1979414 RepID=UPI0039E84642
MLSEAELIQIRRHLHEDPEIGMQEFHTHDFLLKQIARLPQDHLSIKTIPEVPTAILVRIAGSNPKRTLGWRTDIDALPIKEATGLPFASQNDGVMHACGHDFHMTVALGILSYFAEHQPADNLLIFFQPAEENEFGGKRFFDAGGFQGDYKPDEFYALHVNPQLPAGQIGSRQGTLFAGSNELRISFVGKSGHAAYPQRANDSIVAAANFVTSVQTVVSRNIDPIEGGVVTIGKFNAGQAMNIIAGQTDIEGTIRSFTQQGMEVMTKHIRMIAQGVADAFGQELKINFRQGGYMPVVNDEASSSFFIKYMEQADNVDFKIVEPAMIAEDFGFLSNQFKGTMCWLGVNDPKHTLHSDHLSPDESAIEKGITAITGFLTARMEK